MNNKGQEMNKYQFFVVKIGNDKIIEKIEFHPKPPVLEYQQESYNICCLSSLEYLDQLLVSGIGTKLTLGKVLRQIYIALHNHQYFPILYLMMMLILLFLLIFESNFCCVQFWRIKSASSSQVPQRTVSSHHGYTLPSTTPTGSILSLN